MKYYIIIIIPNYASEMNNDLEPSYSMSFTHYLPFFIRCNNVLYVRGVEEEGAAAEIMA